jgi:hypothetical protein
MQAPQLPELAQMLEQVFLLLAPSPQAAVQPPLLAPSLLAAPPSR